MRFMPRALPAAPSAPVARLALVLMFVVLCATVAYWTLQLAAPRPAIAPAGSLMDWQKAPDLAAAARMFGVPQRGGSQAAPTVSSNVQVLGVAASDLRGSAVLSVDGGPARAWQAGDLVAEGTRLIQVGIERVVIEQNGRRIELPAPPRPDLSLLGSGGAGSGARLSQKDGGTVLSGGPSTGTSGGRPPPPAPARGVPAGSAAPGAFAAGAPGATRSGLAGSSGGTLQTPGGSPMRLPAGPAAPAMQPMQPMAPPVADPATASMQPGQGGFSGSQSTHPDGAPQPMPADAAVPPPEDAALQGAPGMDGSGAPMNPPMAPMQGAGIRGN